MLSCFSFFMLSIVKPNQYYQVFLPQGVAMGIGALIYLPLMTLVSQHFKARKALPMGIVAAAAPVGAIVFTIMLNHLFYKLGFTQGIRAAAYMTLGLFVLGNALLFVPRTKSISPASTQSDLPIRPARLVWDMPYVLTLTSAFLLSLGSNTPGFYLQLFAEVHGVDKTVVFYCLAIMNVSSFVGRLLPNHLADRVGAINVYIPCLVLTGLVELAMLGCINVVGLILFSIFYGFLFGSVIALYLPMISELTPPGVEMGKRMGVALIPIGVASMVGPPITGAILGPDYVWWKAIVFSSIIILAASACNITARQVHRRGASGQLPPRCESPLDTPHALDSVSTDLEKSCHH
ncbi:hypothetical protein SERLADRAFT_478728 [Serpula lacrymans var. lacrymans S7.9]|nr:uncharacterized protein SERLADRAFT_478728 [Serpula lacrymans var. lacrymans S7.9]EGO20075.1 hypothetical protein SERLADRAFT_478728 [Serpula lacrymans var. lacrymans S7.9]